MAKHGLNALFAALALGTYVPATSSHPDRRKCPFCGYPTKWDDGAHKHHCVAEGYVTITGELTREGRMEQIERSAKNTPPHRKEQSE